jgi:hypothetical protein
LFLTFVSKSPVTIFFEFGFRGWLCEKKRITVVTSAMALMTAAQALFVRIIIRPTIRSLSSLSFSLFGCQRHAQGRSENARCRGASARISLKIVTIKEKESVQARSTASLESILIPGGMGEIEKDFVGYEKVPPIVSAEGSINHKAVTITNWRGPVSD